MIQAGSAKSSHSTYSTGMDVFNTFCKQYSISFNSLQPSTIHLDHLTLFVAYLSWLQYKPNTIRTYLSGISYFSKLHGLTDLTNSFIIKKMLEGYRRCNQTPDSRLPITKPILKMIVVNLAHICLSKYESLLFQTAFVLALLAYHALLRVGEFAAPSKTDTTKQITFSDLQLFPNYLLLKVRFSKTDQFGKSTTLQLHSTPRESSLCPVGLMHAYIKVRPSLPGILFMHLDGSPLTRFQASSMLHRSLEFSDFKNRHMYKMHSFRIGRCTDLSKNVEGGKPTFTKLI